MEPRRFELTPEQKGMLASLCREAGQPLSTLLAAITDALEELQEKERREHEQGTSNGHEIDGPTVQEVYKPIWERIPKTFSNLSKEDLERLPVDGAAQVDHYAYGLPKR
jgi:hypothetical protein